MPVQVLMPALSPTMTEGKIARWLKKEGDVVKSGMVIAEIETDKATMEVEAVDEGILGKILVPEGTEQVRVNAPIALIGEAGEDFSSFVPVSAPVQSASQDAPKAVQSAPRALVQAPMVQNSGQSRFPTASIGRIIASPLARRVASAMGLDLRYIKGSGPNGRIVLHDVEKPQPSQQPAPAQAVQAVPKVPDARQFSDLLGMEYTTQSNSMVRKVIAKRLTESKQTVPHFYLTVDCRIDALLAARKGVNADGAKVSVNDLVIKAVALSLQDVPAANAAWTDDNILLYKHADVSVAVATPDGLITPIIKMAETKDVKQISTEMKDLAGRARENKLKPTEFQGGTFTVSNLGMFGISDFAAIINPPQACILAVGAGMETPVIVDGKIEIGTVMKVTLSVDHRVVDGAVGAEFLKAFKAHIEEPSKVVA